MLRACLHASQLPRSFGKSDFASKLTEALPVLNIPVHLLSCLNFLAELHLCLQLVTGNA